MRWFAETEGIERVDFVKDERKDDIWDIGGGVVLVQMPVTPPVPSPRSNPASPLVSNLVDGTSVVVTLGDVQYRLTTKIDPKTVDSRINRFTAAIRGSHAKTWTGF